MIQRFTSPAVQTAGFMLGALIISLSTLMPLEQLPTAPGSDKLHHVLGFAFWALLCALGPKKRFTYMALFIIFWGGAIELIQPYVNRYTEWLDFYADALGVILIIMARLLIERFLESKLKV
ncbi:MAG: hypothetical protein HWE24_01375 [Oceanospirillaceae bacterium]|nr:hypothetical protein [Oceanospirillaceae bacterium]